MRIHEVAPVYLLNLCNESSCPHASEEEFKLWMKGKMANQKTFHFK